MTGAVGNFAYSQIETLAGHGADYHQVVRWIAQLGGFLRRKSDGEPGVTTIWRGWQRLQDLAATWEIVKELTQLVSNRFTLIN
jgi:hypothetical protein